MAEPKDPEVFFDMTEPKLKEVNNIIRKARAKSPPGPNQVPYLVNKNGPLLAKSLWRHLRIVWRKGCLAEYWLNAEGCLIPKEENLSIQDASNIPAQYHTSSKRSRSRKKT